MPPSRENSFTGRTLSFGSESTTAITSIRHPPEALAQAVQKGGQAMPQSGDVVREENPRLPHALQYSQLQQVLSKASFQCDL